MIVDDDLASCRTLQLHFNTQGYEVTTAQNVDDGLKAAKQMQPDLIILDIKMPGRSGLQGLPDFKLTHPETPVIMITAFHDMESTIEAMQHGACEYIHKPIDIDELDKAVSNALQHCNVHKSDLEITPANELHKYSMVGKSWMMKEVFKTIGLVASQPLNVMITGESGTGKELAARAIYNASERSTEPFIALNCAALVETLLESELFGHEKGAFTGALQRHSGKFEQANGGTIFLDEIGELSPSIQAKLLRVLQEKEFTPVGSSKPQKTDARIIAATNVNLEQQVKDGHFREDLYYRLCVVTIDMPPLRERGDDILPLVETLLGRINKELKRNITRLSQETLNAFITYDWPGNVRELNNVLMKAAAMCQGDIITLDLIPDEIAHDPKYHNRINRTSDKINNDDPLPLMSLNELEKQHLIRVLRETSWHKGKTCKILGVSRPRLRRMMVNFNIQQPQ